MGPHHLRPLQLLCLLGAMSSLPWAGALLCYKERASLFKPGALHNWDWIPTKSMACSMKDNCEETVVLIETGTSRGVVSFKGCSSALPYSPQVSYLISPPGVSVASYSHICRTYLCNNLTNLEPFMKLKANALKSVQLSSHKCPVCVGDEVKDCLSTTVPSEPCPSDARECFSSLLNFRAGTLNTTFMLMGCAQEHHKLLEDIGHIGSLQVTEVNLNKSQVVPDAGCSRRGSSWGIILGFLPVFRDLTTQLDWKAT